jgi:hypothetical protein
MDRNLHDTLSKIETESADRRGFLKQAGKLAVSVPAVALLLSANATPAEAFSRYGRGPCKPRGHGHAYGHSRLSLRGRPGPSFGRAFGRSGGNGRHGGLRRG